MVEFAALVFLIITAPIWISIGLALGFFALILAAIVAAGYFALQYPAAAGVIIFSFCLLAALGKLIEVWDKWKENNPEKAEKVERAKVIARRGFLVALFGTLFVLIARGFYINYWGQ